MNDYSQQYSSPDLTHVSFSLTFLCSENREYTYQVLLSQSQVLSLDVSFFLGSLRNVWLSVKGTDPYCFRITTLAELCKCLFDSIWINGMRWPEYSELFSSFDLYVPEKNATLDDRAPAARLVSNLLSEITDLDEVYEIRIVQRAFNPRHPADRIAIKDEVLLSLAERVKEEYYMPGRDAQDVPSIQEMSAYLLGGYKKKYHSDSGQENLPSAVYQWTGGSKDIIHLASCLSSPAVGEPAHQIRKQSINLITGELREEFTIDLDACRTEDI